MTVHASQSIIGGGSVTTISRRWTPEEASALGKDRKIAANAAFKRLLRYTERVELAGGAGPYYASGGCLGPWGPKGENVKKAGRIRKAAKTGHPPTLEDRARNIARLEGQLERERYALRMDVKQAAADGEAQASIGRRIGRSRELVRQMLHG